MKKDVCKIINSYIAPPICGENEYYSECGDDGCQGTCSTTAIEKKNRFQFKDNKDECSPTCSNAACICKPGFVRNIEGACIPPEQCRMYLF